VELQVAYLTPPMHFVVILGSGPQAFHEQMPQRLGGAAEQPKAGTVPQPALTLAEQSQMSGGAA